MPTFPPPTEHPLLRELRERAEQPPRWTRADVAAALPGVLAGGMAAAGLMGVAGWISPPASLVAFAVCALLLPVAVFLRPSGR